MSGIISGNMVGGAAPLRTLIIEDTDGNQITGVVTGNEVIFTATDNDVREGMVYASDGGVSTGTKVIPAYHTYQGAKIVTDGSTLSLSNVDSKVDSYDYTKMQAIVCSFNTSISDSVSAQIVSIDDKIYDVKSTEIKSTVTKDHNSKLVNFGITNNTGATMIIRYFMYKEMA